MVTNNIIISNTTVHNTIIDDNEAKEILATNLKIFKMTSYTVHVYTDTSNETQVHETV